MAGVEESFDLGYKTCIFSYQVAMGSAKVTAYNEMIPSISKGAIS